VNWKKALVQPKILLFLLVGGVLLVASNWLQGTQPARQTSLATSTTVDATRDPTKTDISEYEKNYEDRLTAMLGQMKGLSNVSVLVNMQSTEGVTYAEQGSTSRSTTTANDNRGGTSTTTQTTDNNTVVITKGANGDVPLVVQKTKPQITGVWVEANGVSDPTTRMNIETAIVRVLDIPAHRITITEKQ
jgi:stage III sporulation protein AG